LIRSPALGDGFNGGNYLKLISMVINCNSGFSSANGVQPVSHIPRRISLVDETVSALKASIKQGELAGTLPGEMQLKKHLHVGRDTVRRALKVLVTEGWILPAGQGRKSSVKIPGSRRPRSQHAAKLPVTFLSPPGERTHGPDSATAEIQQELRKQGVAVQFIAPEIFKLSQPQRQLEQLVRQYPSSGWILHQTTPPIQRWFAKHAFPVLLYEAPFAGIDLPFVADDWEAAAFHAGAELTRYGHRQIAMLEANQRDSKSAAAQNGLKRAFATVNARASVSMRLLSEDGSPASVAAALESAVSSKSPLTALIITRSAQLMNCYSWLVSRGLRVPANMSIISLASDRWFNTIFPKVCHYQTQTKIISREIATRINELVSNGSVTARSLYVPLTYVVGATVGSVEISSAIRGSAGLPLHRS
jgi:LacI family transcriptional regulator